MTGRTPACEDAATIAERMRELQAERMAAIGGCACSQRDVAGNTVHTPPCPLRQPPGVAAMASPTQIEAVPAAVERLRARRKHRDLPSPDELEAEGHAAIEAARHRVLS